MLEPQWQTETETETERHTDTLLLQPFNDLLVRLVDALGLVVFDHRLVQPVLERPDVARQRRVVVL